MIKHKQIIQGTDEWHAIKWRKIGGTLSKGLFVDSDTLFLKLLGQMLEDVEFEDSYQNDSMERGHELEPFAREKLESKLGVKFIETGWLQCEKNYLLGISPDGITEDETRGCELKCFGRDKHTSIIYNQAIPIENQYQVIHYFTVNDKFKEVDFYCFRPESIQDYHKIVTLDTGFNLGTKGKPVWKDVGSWVEIAREKAGKLKCDLETAIEKLSF